MINDKINLKISLFHFFSKLIKKFTKSGRNLNSIIESFSMYMFKSS